MRLLLASISPRQKKPKSAAADALTLEFVERAARYYPTTAKVFESEAALLAEAERQTGRAAATLLLFDSRGESLSSEEFADGIGRLRDGGVQRMVLGIGPADGWSAAARGRAQRMVSFGRVTLPHELARAVAAEQIYRALTILAGHPYHSGH